MKRHAVAAALAVLIAGCVPQPEKIKDWVVIEHQGYTYRVLLLDDRNERSEPIYRDAIASLCGTDKVTRCVVQFWIDARLVPPFGGEWTPAQAAGQTVNYVRNPRTRGEKFHWNCRLNNDPNNCFTDD
jgi:hypothetical protein